MRDVVARPKRASSAVRRDVGDGFGIGMGALLGG